MLGVGVGVMVGVSVKVGSKVGVLVLVEVAVGLIVSVFMGEGRGGFSTLCCVADASGTQPSKSDVIVSNDINARYFREYIFASVFFTLEFLKRCSHVNYHSPA
jgi:hypothetical protein